MTPEGLTIVIPAYNEAGSLREVVEEALGQGSRLSRPIEVIVVDDGSTDGTSELLDELAQRLPVRALHHLQNRGSGQAIVTGARRARMPLIVYAPADGQFAWQDLPAFLEAAREADVVMGIRSSRMDYSPVRKLQSAVYLRLVNWLFGHRYADVNWVHLWRREVFQRQRIRSRGVFFLEEVLLSALDRGMRVAEVAATYVPRRAGQAKGSAPRVILLTLRELAAEWLRRKRGPSPFEPEGQGEALGHATRATLRAAPGVLPRWLASGESLPICLDGAIESMPGCGPALATVGRWPALARDAAGALRFGFDPGLSAAAMLLEAHVRSRKPLAASLPDAYLAMPGWLRLALHTAFARLGARAGDARWTMDPPVDALRALSGLAPAGPGWPAGKSWAVCITLDVDSEAGLVCAPGLARLASSCGHRVTAFVAGRAARALPARVEELAAAGAEIGLHGDRHDYSLGFQPLERIEGRLDDCKELMERFGMVGFRAPGLLLTPRARRALAGRFLYDSSVPDSDAGALQAPLRGCGTVFPFRQPEGILELPLTLPLEDRLMTLGFAGERLLDVWRLKARQVREAGGLLILTTHAEPHLGGSPAFAGTYRTILEELAAMGGAWEARCADVARLWQTESTARAA